MKDIQQYDFGSAVLQLLKIGEEQLHSLKPVKTQILQI